MLKSFLVFVVALCFMVSDADAGFWNKAAIVANEVLAAAAGQAPEQAGVRPGSEFSVSVSMPAHINMRFIMPSENALKRKTGIDLKWPDHFTGYNEIPNVLHTTNKLFLTDVAFRYGDLEYYENRSGMTPAQWKAQNFIATVLAPNPLIVIADNKFPLSALSAEQLKELLSGQNTVFKDSPKSKTSWEIHPIVIDDRVIEYTLRRDLLNDRSYGDNVSKSNSMPDIVYTLSKSYVAPNKKTGIGKVAIAILGSWDSVWNKQQMSDMKLVKTDLKVNVPIIAIVAGGMTPGVKKMMDFYKGEGAMYVTPELPRQLAR